MGHLTSHYSMPTASAGLMVLNMPAASMLQSVIHWISFWAPMAF